MAQVYEIRLKATALENLKGARDQVRLRMGTRNVGDTLTGMSTADAGNLANDLLNLLDAIDTVVGRAKAADRYAPPCTGAVLVGGASRRMGRPKATLLGPGDETFLTLAVRALGIAGADPVLIVGGDPPADAAGARHVPDLSPGRGPLAGLEAALEASPHEWVLLVACDMPRLDPGLLGRLIQHTRTTESEAVVPEVEGRLQPLHAVYRRTCLTAARAALAQDRLGITAFVRALDPEVLSCEANRSFDNVNTPEDLSQQGLNG